MAGGQIKIQAGGGITIDNIDLLIAAGCNEFHLTGSETCVSPAPVRHHIHLNGSMEIPESDYKVSSVEKISEIKSQTGPVFQERSLS